MTVGNLRSENEPKILYTIKEKALLCSLKVCTFEKQTHSEINFHCTLHSTAWPPHFQFAFYAYDTELIGSQVTE